MKIGYCPQCNEQIMVRDCSGRWSSFKPNLRAINLIFEDGHQTRIFMCAKCLDNVQYDKIMDVLTKEKSQAFVDDSVREKMKARVPLTHRVINLSTGKAG